MREILFRGKRTIAGNWCEGFLVKTGDHFRISTRDDLISFGVYTETVGQYTGLTDKNGKRIFEGDIVKLTDEITGFETFAFVEFGNPNGQYNWGFQLVPMEKKPFAVEILLWVEMEETGAFIEVVGNIHDNPELLKGEKT